MSVETILSELYKERARIDAAIKALESISGTTSRGASKRSGERRRRVLSAEARKRIADAQRARWAKQKVKK